MFGLKEEIIEEIKGILKRHREITGALIFGSRARGDYKYNSDIDIAVYSSGELPRGLWMELDEAAGIYGVEIYRRGDQGDGSCGRVKTVKVIG